MNDSRYTTIMWNVCVWGRDIAVTKIALVERNVSFAITGPKTMKKVELNLCKLIYSL